MRLTPSLRCVPVCGHHRRRLSLPSESAKVGGVSNPLVLVSGEEMRKRRSLKWSLPSPVLGMAVAEADVELASPIRLSLHSAVGRSCTGSFYEAEPLFDAVARFAHARWSWRPDRTRMLVGPSVNATVVALLRGLVVPGDVVAYSSPVYPVFRHLPGYVLAEALDVPLRHFPNGSEWALDLAAIDHAFSDPKVRVYLLCHPQNPVGTVHPVTDLAALASSAIRHGVTVISDEIHAPLDLRGSFRPLLSCGSAAEAVGLCVTGASKAWNLSGVNCSVCLWNNPAFDQVVQGVAEGLRWETSTLGACAARAAFSECQDWLDEFCSHLRVHVEILGEAAAGSDNRLRFCGIDAGYLAWLDLRQSLVGAHPAELLLRQARVATSSGTNFGPAGAGHCRLNVACSTETLLSALDRVMGLLTRS